MSTSQRRIAPGLLLLLFGVWPWVVTGGILLFEELVGWTRHTREPALVAGFALGLLGAAGALVAMGAGVAAWWRARRESTPGDAPRRPAGDGRFATPVARIGSLLAVITLWGPFGALFIGPVLAGDEIRVLSDLTPWMFVLTPVCAIAGVVLLARSRRQRSS